MQLRYLQTLSLISGDQNKNIIFPFPVNLIKQLVLGPQASCSKKTLTKELPEERDFCTCCGSVDEALEVASKTLDAKVGTRNSE